MGGRRIAARGEGELFLCTGVVNPEKEEGFRSKRESESTPGLRWEGEK